MASSKERTRNKAAPPRALDHVMVGHVRLRSGGLWNANCERRVARLSEFVTPGEETLIVRTTEDVLEILRELPESERRGIGGRAREQVLVAHSAAHRAAELKCI